MLLSNLMMKKSEEESVVDGLNYELYLLSKYLNNDKIKL